MTDPNASVDDELADAQDLGCGKSPVIMHVFNNLR
jgi:hypothetical protein